MARLLISSGVIWYSCVQVGLMITFLIFIFSSFFFFCRLYFAASLWKNVKKKFSRAGGHHWDGPSVQYIRSWVLSWKITYLPSRAERNWSGHYPQILITLLRSRGRLRSERLPFLFETIRNRNIIVYYILKSPIFLFFSFLFFPKCSSMRRAISVFHNSPLPFSTVL